MSAAPEVRFVKRGRFRKPEPVPDHIQAAWAGLPVNGLPATTMRELLHNMAGLMVTMAYKREHHPYEPIGTACMPWMACLAAQAKALIYAARLSEDHWLTEGPDFPMDMPVPQPIKVSTEDCRARFLDLYGDGALTAELTYRWPSSTEPSTPEKTERRKAMGEAAYRLYEDMIRAGIVRDEPGPGQDHDAEPATPGGRTPCPCPQCGGTDCGAVEVDEPGPGQDHDGEPGRRMRFLALACMHESRPEKRDERVQRLIAAVLLKEAG